MKVVGFGIIQALVERERFSPRGKALHKPAEAWRQEVELANWRSLMEVKAQHRTADIVGKRIVFDILGNSYRFVVQLNYGAQVAEVRFAGTHKEYDHIDVRTI